MESDEMNCWCRSNIHSTLFHAETDRTMVWKIRIEILSLLSQSRDAMIIFVESIHIAKSVEVMRILRCNNEHEREQNDLKMIEINSNDG
jgi:hypothetical protein